MKKNISIASLLLLTLLTACSKKDSAEHYRDAQNLIATEQYNAAIIELRSAIQKNENDYLYRLALGHALLKSGDALSAERELERALRYGASYQEVALDLIKAHYLSGNYPAAAALYADAKDVDEKTKQILQSFAALSEIEAGDSPAGLLHFEQLSTSELSDIAAFAQAHLKLAAQEPEAALVLLDVIEQSSELFNEALFLKGKINLADNELLAAISTLKPYTEQTPSAHLARLLLAQAYVRNTQFVEAEQQLDYLLRLFPEQPMANYLKSIARFEAADFTAAKLHSEKAITSAPVSINARMIAATASARLGLESQALNHLEPIRGQLHLMPEAQRLYAILQLRAGETEQARAVLQSLPEEEQNLELVASTAFALVSKGLTESAQGLISHYEQHAPRDSVSLAALGTIKLDIESQREAGIRDLEQALELDPTINQARLVLAKAYLEQGEYDKVFSLAEDWLNDLNTKVSGLNLQAYTRFLQQQFDEASALSEQALVMTPLHPFSSLLQAMIKARKGDVAAARAQLQNMLAEHPDYLVGLEHYYALSRLQQNTEDAENRIEQLFQRNQEDYSARLLRARVAHDKKNYALVTELLSKVTTNLAELPAIHHLLLIESQQESGQLDLALRTAEQWSRAAPDSLQASYLYANALTLNQRNSEALDIINRLLQRYPQDARLLVGQLSLLIKLQRLDQAGAVLNSLPQELSKNPQFQFLHGRLAFLQGNLSDSLQAFQNSYQQNPTHEAALFLAVNTASAQSEQDAVSFLTRHLEQHGSNPALDTYYATLLLKTDAEKSQAMYKKLLEQEPDNVVALNNYAWLLTENKQAKEAKAYAERALALVPNHPDIIDTYGKVLLQLEQPEQALKQFEQSLSLRPGHAEVMLNYAEALHLSKQSNKAREILAGIQSEEPVIIERKARLERELQR